MRWTRLYAFALASLASCYNPNYSSKPCMNDSGCPMGYFCDVTRSSTVAPGTCSPGSSTGDMAQADMAPQVPTEHLVNGAPSFYLGSTVNDGITSNDQPGYLRSMHSFCAAETEVTVSDYSRCLQAGACTPPAGGSSVGCNFGIAGRENYPVNCVDLPQAQAFCTWIGRRLPTESEWEYAANGPTMNTMEKYPWAGGGGSFVASDACFNIGGTCPVGSTNVRTYAGATAAMGNPGFSDLAGNVWEWTTSEFCPYQMNMPDLTCASPGRVVRGGSGFDNDPRLLRSTVRLGNAKDSASTTGDMGGAFPNSWFKNLGFRCFGDVNAQGGCGP